MDDLHAAANDELEGGGQVSVLMIQIPRVQLTGSPAQQSERLRWTLFDCKRSAAVL